MSKKILVAEDSSVIQNLTRRILGQLHYEIVSVKNGEEVLEELKSGDFDLLLLDIHMPKMNGMDCAKSIRASSSDYNDIPIIAITGNANNYTEADFKEVGINAFIPKPLNFDMVVEHVKKFIE